MATIINTPPAAPSDGGNGSMGMIVGLILVLVIGFLFFVYGLPAMRGTQNANNGSTPTINVPDKVDINIKK